jgi:tol-pal system beta propeller repeat protein TolB
MKKLVLLLTVFICSSCSAPATIGPGTGISVFFSSLEADSYDIYRVVNNTPVKVNKSKNNFPNFDISSDGKKAVYISENNELDISDVDGNGLKIVVKDKIVKKVPRFSPDGKTILYTGMAENNDAIFRVDADGTNLKMLSKKGIEDNFPVWSADGQKIAFTSRRDKNNEIYTMNPDGSEQTNITKSPNQDYSPFWSPDQKKITFTSLSADDKWKIFTVNSDGSQLTKISDGNSDIFPVWSPDNKNIAYVSRQGAESETGGSNRIKIFELGTKKETELGEGIDTNYPSWSADGKILSFKTLNKNTYELNMYNIATKSSIKFKNGTKDIFNTISR